MNDYSVSDADAAEVAFRRGARILVTRLRYLGDALLSLPLVAALRRALPECELHYMAEPGPIELLREQPEIDVRWRVDRGAWPALRLVSQLRLCETAQRRNRAAHNQDDLMDRGLQSNTPIAPSNYKFGVRIKS